MTDEDNDVKQQAISYYNSPMNSQGGSILTLTDPAGEITRMELTFRGLMLDPSNGKLKNVGYPLMNEKGILSVIGQVQALVNQVTIMSNLSKENLENIMKYQFIYTLTKDLMLNESRYEMGIIREKIEVSREFLNPVTNLVESHIFVEPIIYFDRAARDKVHSIAINTAFICAKRAVEGDDKRFWKGTQHENITRVESTGGGSRGVGGLFSGLFKGKN